MTSVANNNEPLRTSVGSSSNARSMPPPPSSSSSPPTSGLSAYLAMTPQDVERMSEASKALQACLRKVPIPESFEGKPPNNNKDDDKADNGDGKASTASYLDCSEAVLKLMDQKGGTLALHGMLVEAAQQCNDSIVKAFLSKMEASGATEAEAKAGLVIFHEMDKSSKLRLFFEILAASRDNDTSSETEGSDVEATKPQHEHDHKENALPNKEASAPATVSVSTPKKAVLRATTSCLDQDGSLSLFKTILTAISCCVHTKDEDDTALKPVVTQDEDHNHIPRKDSFDHPPQEMTKTGETSTKEKTPSPQPPNGLAENLKKDIDCTAKNASRRLVDFAAGATKSDPQKQEVSISFETFGEWYNSGGCQVVPWLELLHLSKWRKSTTTVVPPSSTTSMPTASSLSRKLPPKLPPASSLSSMLREDEEAMHHRMAHGRSGAHHHQNRTVITFDFSSSVDPAVAHPLCINVSEENLSVLRTLVYRSGLVYRSAAEVCRTIMRMSHKRVWDGRPLVTMRRDDFRQIVRTLLTPPTRPSNRTPMNPLSQGDMENFGMILEDFFACYEGNFHQSTTTYHPLSHDEVNAKELAVGFSLLCAGNKSTKLATGFELLDDARCGYLNQQQLLRFLRSYLTMMVGTSLLKDGHARKRQPLLHERKEEMRSAVENGAHWTLRHFLKTTREKHPDSHMRDAYSFEVFAEWYSQGGFNVAPWLELLDLNKMVSLLSESGCFAAMPQTAQRRYHQKAVGPSSQSSAKCRSSHRRQHHNRATEPPAQVLFTFPLANQRSLIVLREDAIYVRGVVEQLGALTLAASDIWQTLTSELKKRPNLRGAKPRGKKGADPDKNTLVDLNSFIEMMEVVLQSAAGSSRKRAAAGSSKLSSSVQEVLTNLFHSYDLKQTNMVALNELMGGLALLCGGKKSTKLAFAFGVFDGRPKPKTKKGKNKLTVKDQSLDVTDLYLFLRSVLIVLFSCCCQTLEMGDSSVDRYIADTANMVADDVMRYQWHTRKKDRIDFDEFGEWYNEGGFEIAPWLELLDLKKWVLVDNFDAMDTQASAPPSAPVEAAKALTPKRLEAKDSPTCPPPPPEDVLDPSFFEDNDDIMHMDSIDEMDIMLMPSHDKEGDLIPVNKFTYSPSQDRSFQALGDESHSQPLKFHLLSEEEKGGFMLSISQKRIRHFRQLMVDSGLPEVSTETACNIILSHSSATTDSLDAPQTISKEGWEAAVRDIVELKDHDNGADDHRALLDVLNFVYSCFDPKGTEEPNATEVACGFTVLCRGKKSDKLEYAFEVLDKNKKGELAKSDIFHYMRSFLTVLLGVGCSPTLDTDEVDDSLNMMNGEGACDRTPESVVKAVEAGANWAVAQAFKRRVGLGDTITFDDFAAWYTEEGHISIPWIELLALKKWVI